MQASSPSNPRPRCDTRSIERFLGDPAAYARFESAIAPNGIRLYGYAPRTPMRYRHMHAQHPMLTMVLDGRARSRMRYAGREVEIDYGAGDLTCYGGGIDIVEAAWQYERACFITVELDRGLWRDSPWPIACDRPIACRPRFRDPELARLVLALWHAARRPQPEDRLYAESLTAGLWLRLRGKPQPLPALPAETPAAKPLAPKQLDAVVALMHERLGESLRLEQMANAVGMSTDHFARRFAATTGTTPHRYLMNLRVQRARRLLARSDMPVAHIAVNCGFSSQAHMTATFRQLVGVTPARWRRDQRRADAQGTVT